MLRYSPASSLQVEVEEWFSQQGHLMTSFHKGGAALGRF
jgi:hypothetical protein